MQLLEVALHFLLFSFPVFHKSGKLLTCNWIDRVTFNKSSINNNSDIENEEIMILIIIIINNMNTSLFTDGLLSCKVVFNINGSAR